MSATGIGAGTTPAVASKHTLPHIIAQRGNTAEFPENTLPALRSALELGIQHLEIDVHLTADFVPVVASNHSLLRTANLNRSIFDYSASELAHVRASEPARFGNRFADVGIPTLTQAAELLAAFPTATAFVDIHTATLQRYGVQQVARRVDECLNGVRNQVVLITPELAAVEFIRQRCDYRIGWVLAEYNSLSALKCEAIAPDFLFCSARCLPNDHGRLWRGPWQWAIGDVLVHTQAREWAARGASFVRTTEVRTLLRELRHLRSKLPGQAPARAPSVGAGNPVNWDEPVDRVSALQASD